MLPALDPDPESDFQLFDDSGYRFDSVKSGVVTPKDFKPLDNS